MSSSELKGVQVSPSEFKFVQVSSSESKGDRCKKWTCAKSHAVDKREERGEKREERSDTREGMLSHFSHALSRRRKVIAFDFGI